MVIRLVMCGHRRCWCRSRSSASCASRSTTSSRSRCRVRSLARPSTSTWASPANLAPLTTRVRLLVMLCQVGYCCYWIGNQLGMRHPCLISVVARAGPASFLEQATIFYAPDTANSTDLMRLIAQAAACPADATRKSSTSASFYRRASTTVKCQPSHTYRNGPRSWLCSYAVNRLIAKFRHGTLGVSQDACFLVTERAGHSSCSSGWPRRQVLPGAGRAALLQRPGAVPRGRGLLRPLARPPAARLRQ